MSDTLERRLRESMERRAGDLEVFPAVPPSVMRRARRRQALVAALAGVAAAAVITASVIGVRAAFLDRGQGRGPAGAGATRTVRGVTVTVPTGWYFENVASRAAGTGLFIVANYSPAVPLVDVPDDRVCRPTAAVLAVQETFRVVPGSMLAHRWPTELRPAQPTVRGCGGTESASWTVAGRSFQASALFGRHVSAQDRATLLQVFATMRFGPSTSGPPSLPVASPSGTVIAQGSTAGVHWILTANTNRDGSVTLEVTMPGQGFGIGVPRGPGGQTPIMSPQSIPLGNGAGAKVLLFGFVSRRVSSVHVEPGHEIGTVSPIPAEQQLQAFIVVVGRDRNATVVAEDAAGKVLARQSIGPPNPVASPVARSGPSTTPSP
jgi:hypothetical protein